MTESTPASSSAPSRFKTARSFLRLDLGVAGFVMSLGLTLAGLYSDARGADIAVRPLDQMLLYRDGEGARSVLNATFKLVLLNAADASHGDMVLEADLELGGLRFAMGGTVQPTFTMASDAASKCPLDSRCVVRPGLVVRENPDEILDVPGGSHLLTSLNFPIVAWNCTGSARRCADLASASAQQALFRGGGVPRVSLRLHADGERELQCRVGPIDLAYLQKIGWSAVACKDSSVKGGPLF